MTREEWNAMTPEEQWQHIAFLEKDNDDMRTVLSEIPECPHHGFCLPHFRNWIRDQQGKPRTNPVEEYLMLMMEKEARLLIEKRRSRR